MVVPGYRCPSTLLDPTNQINGFVFGCIDYAANGGTRIYHPKTDPNKAYAAAKKFNDGLFNLVEPNDTGILLSQITDGLSNTLMFGERKHEDAMFDKLYGTGSGYPLAGWCGWGWTADINSVGDTIGHSAVPINYMIPTTSTNQKDEVWNRLGARGEAITSAERIFAWRMARSISSPTAWIWLRCRPCRRSPDPSRLSPLPEAARKSITQAYDRRSYARQVENELQAGFNGGLIEQSAKSAGTS